MQHQMWLNSLLFTLFTVQVILVKWNEPYQKLATCDAAGVIFVWIKHEGRWSIELINDRNSQVKIGYIIHVIVSANSNFVFCKTFRVSHHHDHDDCWEVLLWTVVHVFMTCWAQLFWHVQVHNLKMLRLVQVCVTVDISSCVHEMHSYIL